MEAEKQDLDALRNNLRNLQASLANERMKAQKQLFHDFTQNIMGMAPDDERATLLADAYLHTVTQLADESVPIHIRLQSFVNSDFLYSLLVYKNLRYEREIKKFLKHLNDLLITTSQEGETKDFKSLETYFNRAITGALDLIEPEAAENRDEIVTMIVDAIGEPFRPRDSSHLHKG